MKKLFQTFAKAIALCAMIFALSFSLLASTASAQPAPYGFPSFFSYFGGGFFPSHGFQGYGFFPFHSFDGTMNPDADDAISPDEDEDVDTDQDEDEADADADEAQGYGYGHFFGGMNKEGVTKGFGGGPHQYQGYHPFFGGMKKWGGPGAGATKDAPADTTKDAPAEATTDATPAS